MHQVNRELIRFMFLGGFIIGGLLISYSCEREHNKSYDCIEFLPRDSLRVDMPRMLELAEEEWELQERNILDIAYDSTGCWYILSETFDAAWSKAELMSHFIINEKGNIHFAESPKQAFIRFFAIDNLNRSANVSVLKNFRFNLNSYYSKVWNDYALLKFGKPLKDLGISEQNVIQEEVPMNVIDDYWNQSEDPNKGLLVK